MATLSNAKKINLSMDSKYALGLACHGAHLYAALVRKNKGGADHKAIEIWSLNTADPTLGMVKAFSVVKGEDEEGKPIFETTSRGVSLAVQTTTPNLVAAYRENQSGGGGEAIHLATWAIDADDGSVEDSSQELELVADMETVPHTAPAARTSYQTTLDPRTDEAPSLSGGSSLRLTWKMGKHTVGMAWETASGWDWPYQNVQDIVEIDGSSDWVTRTYGQSIRVGSNRPDKRDDFPHTEKAPALSSDWVLAFKDGYLSNSYFTSNRKKEGKNIKEADYLLVLKGTGDGTGWTTSPANGRSHAEDENGKPVWNAPGVLVKGNLTKTPLTAWGPALVDAPGGTDILVYANANDGGESGDALYQASGGVSGIASAAGPFPTHAPLRGPDVGTTPGPKLLTMARPQVAYQKHSTGAWVWLSFVDANDNVQLYRFDYSA